VNRFFARCGSVLIAGLFLLSFSLNAMAADPAASHLTLNERAYIASRIFASLDNFAQQQNATNLDVEATYRAYLDKALASEDRVDFDRASMEFLASFHNAHTMFIDMPLIQQGGALPFCAVKLKQGWVITASWTDGVKPGDVVEGIDGQSFDQFEKDRLRYVASSTEAHARRVLFARMPAFAPFAHLFPEEFVLTLAGGREVRIDRRNLQPAAPMQTEGRWLRPGKVAYIRIPSFFAPEFEKRAIELAHDYAKAPVLIVDVRGNEGGGTPEQLTNYLMDRPYRWWVESTPMVMPFFRLRAEQGKDGYQPFKRSSIEWPSTTQQPAKESFAGKLVLLVDAGCLSACEDFVMPFKDNQRALLVGETTGGSSGQPYTLDLGKGMLVMIGAKREMFPDGSPFEGVGIKPDLPVEPLAADLMRGTDTVLEEALKGIEK
jgi:carboxyl-terminal processing protease